MLGTIEHAKAGSTTWLLVQLGQSACERTLLGENVELLMWGASELYAGARLPYHASREWYREGVTFV